MNVTPMATAPRLSNKKFIFRIIVVLLVSALVGFLGFDYWFYRAVKASLPQRDGTIHLAGLQQPVIVTYDNLGVPNISAASMTDLFFAQGFVTAQDRLWQMDVTRRYASGDLAAILGHEYLKIDREQRILGLRQVAQRAAANMTPMDRAIFEAYAAGVNAYITQHQKTLPLEFRFLTYFPHAWTTEDSVLVGLSMTEFLNHGLYKDELEKEKVLARLGPELTAELFVNSSWRDHPPGGEPPSIENDIPSEATPDEEDGSAPPNGSPPRPPKPRSALEPLAIPSPEVFLAERFRPGSNNWVVSGAHTATGKPLLSNDMHLDLRLPNVWYEAHLTCGDFDVAGVTLPGVPLVIVGHNRRIAWGFTNLGPNVEDLYVEKFNDQGEYLTPSGWVKPENRREVIQVKDGPEVTLDVAVTRHGPIISDIIPGEQRKLALKWNIYDPPVSRIPFSSGRLGTELGRISRCLLAIRRAGAECRLRRCGWQHRLSGHRADSYSRWRRWLATGRGR